MKIIILLIFLFSCEFPEEKEISKEIDEEFSDHYSKPEIKGAGL